MNYFCGYHKEGEEFLVDTITGDYKLTEYLIDRYYGRDWYMDENLVIEEISINILEEK